MSFMISLVMCVKTLLMVLTMFCVIIAVCASICLVLNLASSHVGFGTVRIVNSKLIGVKYVILPWIVIY